MGALLSSAAASGSKAARAHDNYVDSEIVMCEGGIMFVPGPMEHLKSHALAFVAGALVLVASNLYSRYLARQRSEND